IKWFLIISILFCIKSMEGVENKPYPWVKEYKAEHSIEKRINTPEGYERITLEKSPFCQWLRELPLKPGASKVFLFNGEPKPKQDIHAAVIDIDTGKKNLQQCADAIIRLRAEYLFSQKRYKEICFKFTSGDKAEFSKWTYGYRPQVQGNRVRWAKGGSKGRTYKNLKSYLETVFMYAGSASLDKELYWVTNPTWMKIGDVFIKGGFPGHAVIVTDMARHPQTGETVFLLSQSYMPAQDMHILINQGDKKLSPWFKLDISKDLKTPEWTFKWNQLKRFEKVKKPRDTRSSASLTGTFRALKTLPGGILGYIVTFDVVNVGSGTFKPKSVTFATYHYYGGQDLMYVGVGRRTGLVTADKCLQADLGVAEEKVVSVLH
ncbi:DUF4846 domain-containing protein, partial [Planctomycetota bacterium]